MHYSDQIYLTGFIMNNNPTVSKQFIMDRLINDIDLRHFCGFRLSSLTTSTCAISVASDYLLSRHRLAPFRGRRRGGGGGAAAARTFFLLGGVRRSMPLSESSTLATSALMPPNKNELHLKKPPPPPPPPRRLLSELSLSTEPAARCTAPASSEGKRRPSQAL
ncbi:hypothetical protein GUJ93_ZPchr0001g32400 [Zizania palustris]|uniref:Uncharacterized protein n=1 Tax=Zizania palustris TaxID=103762 RepID=A0A8J5RXG9_ZIZPA|nr:hypothetical protein GUJ93_ZPchr0001g32400 [Zizania palustris]